MSLLVFHLCSIPILIQLFFGHNTVKPQKFELRFFEILVKGQATVGPTVKSGQWQAPRINGFSELSQVMSRSITDCKHAACWNQLIYWNVCQ